MATGPLPLRLLLDEAIRLGRRHWRDVGLPTSVVLVATSVAAVLAQFAFFRSLASSEAGIAGCLAGVIVLPAVAVGWLAQAAMTVAAVDVVAGRPVDLRRSWRFILRPRAIGTLLLTGLAIGVAAVCCFFPALYVAPMLCLVLPAMVDEGRFGFAALARSAELTRYNPGRAFVDNPITRAFLLFVFGWFLSALFSLPTQMPFMAVKMVLQFRNIGLEGATRFDPGDPVWLWLDVPGAVLGGLVSALAALFITMALALLFFDCRWRREGSDLEAAIEAVELRPRAQMLPTPPTPPMSPTPQVPGAGGVPDEGAP